MEKTGKKCVLYLFLFSLLAYYSLWGNIFFSVYNLFAIPVSLGLLFGLTESITFWERKYYSRNRRVMCWCETLSRLGEDSTDVQFSITSMCPILCLYLYRTAPHWKLNTQCAESCNGPFFFSLLALMNSCKSWRKKSLAFPPMFHKYIWSRGYGSKAAVE